MCHCSGKEVCVYAAGQLQQGYARPCCTCICIFWKTQTMIYCAEPIDVS